MGAGREEGPMPAGDGWHVVVEDPAPAAEITLSDPAEIAVLAQPLRSRMLRLLSDRPRTVKDLATAMRVPVTRLYYHLNQLEEHGLVRVVATRRAGAQTERAYGVCATSFRLDPSLLEADDLEGVVDGVTSLLDYAKVNLGEAVRRRRISLGDAEDRRALLALAPVRLSKQRQRDLVAALEAVLEEHCRSEDGEDGDEMLVLTAVFPDVTLTVDEPT